MNVCFFLPPRISNSKIRMSHKFFLLPVSPLNLSFLRVNMRLIITERLCWRLSTRTESRIVTFELIHKMFLKIYNTHMDTWDFIESIYYPMNYGIITCKKLSNLSLLVLIISYFEIWTNLIDIHYNYKTYQDSFHTNRERKLQPETL